MAGYINSKYKYTKSGVNDEKHKKVYINPNFNKTSQSNSLPSSQHNILYVNPLFNHTEQNVATKHTGKIFINPNFKSMALNMNISRIQQPLNNECHIQNQAISYSNTHISLDIPTNNNVNNDVNIKSIVPAPISNTKYCLVRRQNEPSSVCQTPSKTNNTVKISKYKSIQIKDMIKNLDASKHNMNKTVNKYIKMSSTPSPKTVASSTPSTFRSRFKLVKNKKERVVVKSKTGTYKRVNRTLLKNAVKDKIKHPKVFRKNNIPCRLFKKYGKCLRDMKGNCKFSHDKKHVSICRKFIKGVCHDKDCLLSHDISSKKMPTCYFYLNGMCSKIDCPYLHVKLNDKTRVCSDFLKGYCEKGDKCLHRHINLCPEMATYKVCKRSKCPYPHKENDKVVNTKKSLRKRSRDMKPGLKDTKESRKTNKDEKRPTDTRYYATDECNDNERSDKCETIKPIRCKLGSLPSFIQL